MYSPTDKRWQVVGVRKKHKYAHLRIRTPRAVARPLDRSFASSAVWYWCIFLFCFVSGSVQNVGLHGFDGRSCGGPGFSDDEVSLSPPRQSYILELGPRHPAYHAAYSDDELAVTSSDDAIGK